MTSRTYYLQLPGSSVPEVLFDLVVRSRRVSATFESEEGHAYRIVTNDDPAVRLVCLNQSLEDTGKHLEELIVECRGVRSEIASMALHLGLADEIPTAGNGRTWPQLAQRLHNHLHGMDEPSVRVVGGGKTPPRSN
jgi:hypothetical protein